MTAAAPRPQPIVLYDGTCGLCHRSVQWLSRRDRGQLWYAPLQGETAAALQTLAQLEWALAKADADLPVVAETAKLRAQLGAAAPVSAKPAP